jgi:hypothetical protein
MALTLFSENPVILSPECSKIYLPQNENGQKLIICKKPHIGLSGQDNFRSLKRDLQEILEKNNKHLILKAKKRDQLEEGYN